MLFVLDLGVQGVQWMRLFAVVRSQITLRKAFVAVLHKVPAHRKLSTLTIGPVVAAVLGPSISSITSIFLALARGCTGEIFRDGRSVVYKLSRGTLTRRI